MSRTIRYTLALFAFAALSAPAVAGCGAGDEAEESAPASDDGVGGDAVADDSGFGGHGEPYEGMTPEEFAAWLAENAMYTCNTTHSGCANGTGNAPSLGYPPAACTGAVGSGACTSLVAGFAGQALQYTCNDDCCDGSECANMIAQVKSMYDTCLTAADNNGDDGSAGDHANIACEAAVRCAKCEAGCSTLEGTSYSNCTYACRHPLVGRSCAAERIGD